MGLFDIFKKKFESVSPAAAKLLQEKGAILIDVRESQEFKNSHAPGAKLISLGALERRLKEIPIEQEILVVCQSGIRSSQAAGILSKNGYQVKNVTGGMAAWQRAGLKVVR
jgi:rhodanese-related sulfurtransferase